MPLDTSKYSSVPQNEEMVNTKCGQVKNIHTHLHAFLHRLPWALTETIGESPEKVSCDKGLGRILQHSLQERHKNVLRCYSPPPIVVKAITH